MRKICPNFFFVRPGKRGYKENINWQMIFFMYKILVKIYIGQKREEFYRVHVVKEGGGQREG